MGIAVTMFTVLCGHLIKTMIVSHLIYIIGTSVKVLVKLYNKLIWTPKYALYKTVYYTIIGL